MTKSEEMDKAWDWWISLCNASQDEYMSRWILKQYKEKHHGSI